MRRLQVLADRVITYWLRQVVDLREPEQPKSWLSQLHGADLNFQVLTPSIQRQIDQSA